MIKEEELLQRLEKIYLNLGDILDKSKKNFCGNCRYCCTCSFLHGVCHIEYEYIYRYLKKKKQEEKAKQFKDYIRKKRTINGKIIYEGCPLYDDEKSACSIYPARPYSCRVFGLYGKVPPPLYCSYRQFTTVFPGKELYNIVPMAKEFFEVKSLYEILIAEPGKEKGEKYYRLAVHQFYRKLQEKSRIFLELAIKEDNENSEAHYQLALYYHNKGNIEKSIKKLEEALIYAPENINMRIHSGLFLMKAERFEKAEEEFRRVMEKEPSHPLALSALANLFLITKRTKAAKIYCERALKKDNTMEIAQVILKQIEEIDSHR